MIREIKIIWVYFFCCVDCVQEYGRDLEKIFVASKTRLRGFLRTVVIRREKFNF